MDVFRDVIPDEQGEHIRKRILERDGPDEKPRAKSTRASTAALLPPDLETRDTEPPQPESDLSQYSLKRLQEGLSYIDAAAKRNITPRTEVFLKMHKDAYKNALNDESPDMASLAVVQALDQVYYSSAFYLRPRSSEDHHKLMTFIQFRQRDMICNYGDYLGQEFQNIRVSLKELSKGASDEVQSAKLSLATPRTCVQSDDELKGESSNELKKHVYVCCGVLGIDPDHMLWLIDQWAERNRVFHNNIREYIENCQWSSLATQLCLDIKEILNVAPDRDTAEQYNKVLLRIRDTYFTTMDSDDPQHWRFNDHAKNLTDTFNARKKKKSRTSDA